MTRCVGVTAGQIRSSVRIEALAVAATRVAPLAALRPVEVPLAREAAGGGRLRLALGGCAVLLGSVLLVLGAWVASVPIACGGGLLAFIGVVTLGGRLLPRAVSAAGAMAGGAGGPVGR